jgi:rubrerythrin
MSDLFNGGEICEMAIETEKKGQAFYRTLAASARTAAVKEFCETMAAAESEHEATFKALLTPLRFYTPPDSYPGEYMTYVSSLLERDVMPSEEVGAKLARDAKSEIEAIDFAIEFEKSTILFLVEMRNFVPAEDRGVIDKLLAEERGHVSGLTQLKKSLVG